MQRRDEAGQGDILGRLDNHPPELTESGLLPRTICERHVGDR